MARNAANAAVSPESLEGRAVIPVGHGQTMLHLVGRPKPADTRRWLEVLTTELASLGPGLELEVLPKVQLPNFLSVPDDRYRLTGFLAIGLDDGPVLEPWQPQSWQVDSHRSKHLAESMLSLDSPGDVGSTFLRTANAYMDAPQSNLAGIVADTLAVQPLVGVVRAAPDGNGGVAFNLAPQGACSSVIDLPGESPSTVLSRYVEFFRDNVSTLDLDVAVVGMVQGWRQQWYGEQEDSSTDHAGRYRISRPLWGSTVPDAHGVMLLRDRAMALTGSLSRWSVTRVGPGHWLLVAKDLDDWLLQGPPPREELLASRSELGGALFRPQV